jgi:hypothetical protein
MPSENLCKRGDENRRWIEAGLLALYLASQEYFEDINSFLETLNEQVQEEVMCRYVFIPIEDLNLNSHLILLLLLK